MKAYYIKFIFAAKKILTYNLNNFPLFLLLIFFYILPGWFYLGNCSIKGFIYYNTFLFFGAFAFAWLFTKIASAVKIIKWIIIAFSTLLTFCELFTFFCQKVRINSTIIGLSLQTNAKEASNFLSLPSQQNAFIKASAFIIIIMTVFLVFNYIWNRWKIDKFLRHNLSNRWRNFSKIILFIFLFLSCLINVHLWKIMVKNDIFFEWFNAEKVNAPLYRLNAMRINWKIREQWNLTKLAQTNSSIKIFSAPTDSLTIVYVIGESHNRHHSSLYGYNLITDPLMAQRFADSSLIVFTDVITGYASTNEAYPRLLSTSYIGDKRKPYEAPLLPAVFKKAGFYTEYYDAQTLLNPGQLDLSCGFLFSNSAIIKQCFEKSNKELYSSDINFVDSCTLTKNKRSFSIYHIWGQHVPCKNFVETIFRSSDYQNIPAYTDTERSAVADYDNCCYAVDQVLNRLITQIEDREAVLIYVADHGELIYDSNHKYGRTFEAMTPEMAKFVMQVPLYIYISDKYKAKFPNRVASLKAAANRPIFNSDISHTIIDLAGIQTNAYVPQLSLFAPKTFRRDRHLPQFGNVIYESFLPKMNKTLPTHSERQIPR